MTSHLKPVDLPDKHLRLVGLIITEWARLENVIDWGLWAYLGISQNQGRALISPMKTKNRIHLFKAVAEQKLRAEQYAELEKILHCAAHFLVERNDMAHAVWQTPDPSGSPYVSFGEIIRMGSFNTKEKEFRVSSMQKNANNIRQMTERLLAFLDQTVDAPPA